VGGGKVLLPRGRNGVAPLIYRRQVIYVCLIYGSNWAERRNPRFMQESAVLEKGKESSLIPNVGWIWRVLWPESNFRRVGNFLSYKEQLGKREMHHIWMCILKRPQAQSRRRCSSLINIRFIGRGGNVQTITPNHLTSWTWVLLEKPPVAQVLKIFPIFYGIRSFVTMFTKASHWFLHWARSTS
jgi:hypothetical protein